MTKSSDLDNWIWSKIDDCGMSASQRNRLAGAAFTTALFHHQATLRLIDASMLPTAFALARTLFEAVIVGLWIENCATNDELARSSGIYRHPKIEKMISGIESVVGFDDKIISNMKAASWKALSDYTHCGAKMLQRMISEEAIETRFSADETREVLQFGTAWSLIAVMGVARLCGNLSLQSEILERCRTETDVQ